MAENSIAIFPQLANWVYVLQCDSKTSLKQWTISMFSVCQKLNLKNQYSIPSISNIYLEQLLWKTVWQSLHWLVESKLNGYTGFLSLQISQINPLPLQIRHLIKMRYMKSATTQKRILDWIITKMKDDQSKARMLQWCLSSQPCYMINAELDGSRQSCNQFSWMKLVYIIDAVHLSFCVQVLTRPNYLCQSHFDTLLTNQNKSVRFNYLHQTKGCTG